MIHKIYMIPGWFIILSFHVRLHILFRSYTIRQSFAIKHSHLSAILAAAAAHAASLLLTVAM